MAGEGIHHTFTLLNVAAAYGADDVFSYFVNLMENELTSEQIQLFLTQNTPAIIQEMNAGGPSNAPISNAQRERILRRLEELMEHRAPVETAREEIRAERNALMEAERQHLPPGPISYTPQMFRDADTSSHTGNPSGLRQGL